MKNIRKQYGRECEIKDERENGFVKSENPQTTATPGTVPDPSSHTRDQMEARNMGYLFENAEKMDIQAERRKTQEARKNAEEAEHRADEAERKADEAEHKADEAERKADEAERKADEAERKADAAKEEADAIKQQMETSVKDFLNTLVELCKKDNQTKEETKECLRDRYRIKEEDLAAYFEEIWDHTN